MGRKKPRHLFKKHYQGFTWPPKWRSSWQFLFAGGTPLLHTFKAEKYELRQILYEHTYFTVSLHDITAALINYTYRQLLQVSDTFGSLFYMYVYFVNMTINGATSSPGTGRDAWMDISPFHIFNRYLFSHTLLSADFAATFLIFMPADMFAPSSWAKTSASHLPASFE